MRFFKAKALVAVVAALTTVAFGTPDAAHASAPANDAFVKAEILGVSGSITRSNVGATQELFEPVSTAGGGFATIWFQWTAQTSGRVTFDTIGTNIDTVLAIYTGTSVLNATEVASNDDGFGCDTSSSVHIDAVVGTSYRIQLSTWDPTTSTNLFRLTWNWARGPQAQNDDLASAATLTTPSVTGSTANSTIEPTLPIPENEGEVSVWYKIPPVSSAVSVAVTLQTSPTPNVFGHQPIVAGQVWAGSTPATASLLASVTADASTIITAHVANTGPIWIRITSPSICEWGGFTLTANTSAGTTITTSYTPFEYQQVLDTAATLGWTPAQVQHDAVLIWQYLYAISGITTPTPVPTPAPGSVALTSVWAPSEMNQLNALNHQWALPSTDTQRVAAIVLVFVLSLS